MEQVFLGPKRQPGAVPSLRQDLRHAVGGRLLWAAERSRRRAAAQGSTGHAGPVLAGSKGHIRPWKKSGASSFKYRIAVIDLRLSAMRDGLMRLTTQNDTLPKLRFSTTSPAPCGSVELVATTVTPARSKHRGSEHPSANVVLSDACRETCHKVSANQAETKCGPQVCGWPPCYPGCFKWAAMRTMVLHDIREHRPHKCWVLFPWQEAAAAAKAAVLRKKDAHCPPENAVEVCGHPDCRYLGNPRWDLSAKCVFVLVGFRAKASVRMPVARG